MHRLIVGFSLCAALVASAGVADANSCNLYSPQGFGEVRIGCSVTVFALTDVEPSLPEITRGGLAISPTVAQDQVTLKVTMAHYPSPDSCNLVTSYENRTFDRYVLAWGDLQAGDEIEIDGYPMTVPGPGDCGDVAPAFYCQDGIQSCPDATTPLPDDPTEDDQGGCAAGSGAPSWAWLFGIAAFVAYNRRARARQAATSDSIC